MTAPMFAFALSPMTMIILLAIGVLLFGRRLPEVGRTLGKGLMEFKKGMSGIEDEVSNNILNPREEPRAMEPVTRQAPPQRITESTPKFTEDEIKPPTSSAPPIA